MLKWKWLIPCVCFLIQSNQGYSQTISGKWNLKSSQVIKLEGFSGLKTYPISTATCNENGEFSLPYSKADYGIGCLIGLASKPIFVILSGEDIELESQESISVESFRIHKGNQNRSFETYAQQQPLREQALSAWAYLDKLYQTDTLFSLHKIPGKLIKDEMNRIKKEEEIYLRNLPEGSYVKWFLPIKKLVSNVSVVAQYRREEIPTTIAAFRNLDYSDDRLYKSGLFKDAVESHFWLLENSGLSLDSVYIEMKSSIDAMFLHLLKDEKKLNETIDFLFDLLERHSFFQASEYLALKALNERSCTINSNLASQLETYRAMKKGNTAADFPLTANLFSPKGFQVPSTAMMSSIISKYLVVVFGASWCPKCKEELPELVKHHSVWKANGVEVLFVSLDSEKDVYYNFVKDFPFPSVCDLKKWDGEMAKKYYVFGTPTMFLIDKDRKILLRPNSVNQLDAWVDWYVLKGNPLR